MAKEQNMQAYKELIEKAQQEYASKNYEDAIKIYKLIQVMYGETLDSVKKGSLYIYLANAYYALNNIDKYAYYYEEYLKLYPSGQASVFSRLAHAYYLINLDKSIDYHNKSLDMEVSKYDIACKLFAMTKSSSYDQMDVKDAAEMEIANLKNSIYKNIKKYDWSEKKKSSVDKKLNIGYLSSDCYAHTMMNYIVPLWQKHDKENFNFFIFNCADKNDGVTKEIQNTGIEIIDCVKLNDEQLAKTIKEKDIDILVELGGFTHLRCFVALYKPAPIIMSYLGYLNTLGMREVDYIIADEYSIPQENAYLYTEKPLYLDTGYQIFSEKNLPDITECPFKKNGYITYGSFNCTSKFSDANIYLWAQILKRNENSKLLIYRTSLTIRIMKVIRGKFEKLGISEDRIIFSSKVYSPHFHAYLLCDIALDTYPFSGMSIAIETALMGVPTVSLEGNAIQSRGAGRINSLLGNEDFNAINGEEYIEKAISLANEKEKLEDLRKNYREKVYNSKLSVGAEEFARDLEDKYKKAWKSFITDEDIRAL